MKYLIGLLVLLLVGCGKEITFPSICYLNKDSGQRLVCLESDHSYRVTYADANEFGTYSVDGDTLNLHRTTYQVSQRSESLDDHYSCSVSTSTTNQISLNCNGATVTLKDGIGTPISNSLTPDGTELVFNRW